MTPTPDPIKTIEEIVDKISTWQGFRDEAMANLPKNVQEFADSTSWAGEELDAERKRLAIQAINKELTRARESTRKIYDKELEMHRLFMSNVLARENLKTEKTMAICDACLKQLKQSQTEGGE